MGLAGGLNLYGYVEQDPVRFTDSSGKYLDQKCLDSIRKQCLDACSDTCSMGPFVAACYSTCVLIESMVESASPGSLCDNEPGPMPRNCYAESQAVFQACYAAGGLWGDCEEKATAYCGACIAGNMRH
jgi:hypothetical protein